MIIKKEPLSCCLSSHVIFLGNGLTLLVMKSRFRYLKIYTSCHSNLVTTEHDPLQVLAHSFQTTLNPNIKGLYFRTEPRVSLARGAKIAWVLVNVTGKNISPSSSSYLAAIPMNRVSGVPWPRRELLISTVLLPSLIL